MATIEELKGHLVIDRKALDEELTNQSAMFYEISEACVDATALRDTLKERVATVDAELDAAYREDYEAKEEKYTETQVKHAVQNDQDHAKAMTAYLKAKSKVEKLQALKEAFIQRNYMLRELCGLHVTGYFQTDSFKQNTAANQVSYEASLGRLNEMREQRRRQK